MPQPQLKFHEETKLLIATGSDEQLMVINDILNELKAGLSGNVAPKPAEPNVPATKSDRLP